MVRRRVVVQGRVQGVFFRDTCRREAVARGVAGWVRNNPNGDVEAVFEGPEAAVDELVAWCQRGPCDAAVTAVEVHSEESEGVGSFRVI